MPAQQRKLTSFSSTLATSKPELKPYRRGQKKLHELKKVVKVEGGAFNFHEAEVLHAKATLEKAASTSAELLDRLRWLSCISVTKELLRSSGIAYAVRPLKLSDDAEVARIAANLIQKWKATLTQQRGQF